MDCLICGKRMAYDGWNGWVWACANCGRVEPAERVDDELETEVGRGQDNRTA
jgi:tRNA(Ile2) C34 agmatinyltransferase TiaS